MITNRRHLEESMAAERVRQNLLFAICLGIAAYIFRELERRQGLQEGREDARRVWVDGELQRLSESELGHRERSATIRRVAQIGVVAATLLGTLAIAYTALLAAHVI